MKRGYTLVETLLTILVMSLMMVMIGTLIRDYSQGMRAQRAGDKVLAGEASLQQIRADLHQALNVTLPTAGGSGGELNLQLLDPVDAATRLPLPAASPASWNPYGPFLTVSYRRAGSKLIRQTTAAAGSQSWTLLDDVEGFQAAWLSDRRLKLTLEVKGVARTHNLQAEAWWPRGRNW